MIRHALFYVIAIALLAGCQVGGVTPKFSGPLPRCTSADQINCIINTDSSQVVEAKPTTDEFPALGIAMSGGGSKAAPFAMGVLKRFVDGPAGEQWIFKTDYLSSVSGSGYAALYLYYRAYVLAQGTVTKDADFPGLTRYFVDARHLNASADAPYFVDIRTADLRGLDNVVSVAESDQGCVRLSEPNYAGTDANAATRFSTSRHYAVYQGWVECYQDLLMTRHSPISTSRRDGGELVGTFGSMVGESVAALPVHYFSNLLFDWRKRLSPSQYDYLYGIERTYAYMPDAGTQLPVGAHDARFETMEKTFDFSDLATIYTMNAQKTRDTVGGYLPKWILQATGASGNIGLDLSRKPYDLATDVFEMTFDEFGSGRYGYVRGSPELVGLTVPLAVLSSAAFADTAQRSLNYPRAAVNALLQGLDIRWGLDIANYNTSHAERVRHAFLVWPFYFAGNDVTGPTGPTIHLSDGGQSGDNLGMISLLRRGVRNIVVAAGENDWHRDDKSDGFISLSSLCSVNYYLVQHGFTMIFEADPRESGFGPATPFDLSQECRWDTAQRNIFVPNHVASSASPTEDVSNLTPFNWARRVWVGKVTPLPAGETERLTLNHKGPDTAFTPRGLDGIKVYYLMSALDRTAWMKMTQKWYATHPEGAPPAPALCVGVTENADDHLDYSCPLMDYLHDTMTASAKHAAADGTPADDASGHWVFPQNNTAFTTYSNSVYLFRAYRDLGWLYANDLLRYAPELKAVLSRPDNAQPRELNAIYVHALSPSKVEADREKSDAAP